MDRIAGAVDLHERVSTRRPRGCVRSRRAHSRCRRASRSWMRSARRPCRPWWREQFRPSTSRLQSGRRASARQSRLLTLEPCRPALRRVRRAAQISMGHPAIRGITHADEVSVGFWRIRLGRGDPGDRFSRAGHARRERSPGHPRRRFGGAQPATGRSRRFLRRRNPRAVEPRVVSKMKTSIRSIAGRGLPRPTGRVYRPRGPTRHRRLPR